VPGFGAMAIAALLAHAGRPRALRSLDALERRLAAELRQRDGMADSTERRCNLAVQRVSRVLRWRGAAGLALGDDLLRQNALARAALGGRRWTEALAATRAAQANLAEARHLR
jgi:hypothetical protein